MHCWDTFASRLVMAGVKLKAVQEGIGHKTIQMAFCGFTSCMYDEG